MIIQLPNFYKDERLNALKAKMRIDRYTYGDFNGSQAQGVRERLNTTGIDLEDISEITVLDDHTLVYNNERVILYIRDVSNYGNYDLPKFHVAKCSTIQQMIDIGRRKRYVATQNDSGEFYLNIISNNHIREITTRLDVCQNCLNTLSWEDFSYQWSESKRLECVARFTIVRFFEKYPKSLLNSDGYSTIHSPINHYSENWTKISRSYRQRQNWTCEQCGVYLAQNTSLLETNHKNGQKNECEDWNLEALCTECHAKRPMHSHMYNSSIIRDRIRQVQAIKREQGIA